jgi:hypothetical protein
MKIRSLVFAVCAGCLLVALLGGASTAVAPSDVAAFQHYRLVAHAVGNAPVAMGSATYGVNRGIAIPAEVALRQQSEHYRAGGIVPWKQYLPMLVRAR